MTDKEKPTRSAGGQLTASKDSRPCDLHEFTQRFIFWGGVSESNQLDVVTFFNFFFTSTSKISTRSNNAPFGHSGIQESAHAGDSPRFNINTEAGLLSLMFSSFLSLLPVCAARVVCRICIHASV